MFSRKEGRQLYILIGGILVVGMILAPILCPAYAIYAVYHRLSEGKWPE